MNKVTVNKQQNAESQDKGMGPGLLVAWSAPRRGEGRNFGPVPALRPPPSATDGPGGDIFGSHILVDGILG